MSEMPFHVAQQILHLKSLEEILLSLESECSVLTLPSLFPIKALWASITVAKDMSREDLSEHAELRNNPVVFQCSSVSILMRQ